MKLSLLLVEESEDCQDALANIIRLRYPDICLHTATHGLEAFRILKEEPFDIIIVDAYMRGSERPSLILEMCSANKRTKRVIAITADSTLTLASLPDDVKESCLKDILEKPISVEDLLKSLEGVIQQEHLSLS